MKYNIFVLAGGKSVEHEISLKSASAIINAINREKYNVYPVYIDNEGVWAYRGLWTDKIEDHKELAVETNSSISKSIADVLYEINNKGNAIIFPALHGQNGEDGTIQGFLEMLNIPYIGCGVIASAIAMDKAISRDLFKEYGLPQTKYFSYLKHNWDKDKTELLEKTKNEITYPVYVKPSNGGSSVGITRVKSEEDIIDAVELAFKYDNKILIEKELVAREMQVAVFGNENPMASLPGEFVMEDPFFDYDSKYINGEAIPVIPANLDNQISKDVQNLAIKAYEILNCTGLTRVDIFVDDENNMFINEANTMPGFTSISMTPELWKATTKSDYTELVEKLIQLGLDNFEKKQSIVNLYN